MILSMSSTAVVLQILTEKGLMSTTAGQSSFVVLLFQDIAVIPILALFHYLQWKLSIEKAGATESDASWVLASRHGFRQLIVLGAIITVIAIGRVIVRPLLRLVAKTKMREIFTASSLLIVIAIAVLMTKVGLSPALGAFLAGVVLANSEFRHELESDIEPFKGLLLGVFFIAVGASIDFVFVARSSMDDHRLGIFIDHY